MILKPADVLGSTGSHQSEQPKQPSVGPLERGLEVKTKCLLEVLGLHIGQSIYTLFQRFLESPSDLKGLS